MKYNVMYLWNATPHLARQLESLAKAESYCKELRAQGWQSWVKPVKVNKQTKKN